MPVSGLDESRPSRLCVGEVELAWVDAGPTQVADAESPVPPLVLVHGFTGHRDDWIEVLPELAKTRRTIAFDLRGHGDSDSPADVSAYSFEQLIKDLIGLLDGLGIDRCDLLGHSFGGMLVLRFALAHPERIRRLILMDTAPEVPKGLSREAWQKAAEIADARGVAFLQGLAEKAGLQAADPILVDRWGDRYWRHHRRRLGAMSPASYRGLGRTLFDSESLVARLGRIDLPSLVLVGESDREFLPGAALLERHLPNVHSVTIPKAGHHPQQENKAAWLAAIEAFIQPTPIPSKQGEESP